MYHINNVYLRTASVIFKRLYKIYTIHYIKKIYIILSITVIICYINYLRVLSADFLNVSSLIFRNFSPQVNSINDNVNAITLLRKLNLWASYFRPLGIFSPRVLRIKCLNFIFIF